jgi:hypothetical protein
MEALVKAQRLVKNNGKTPQGNLEYHARPPLKTNKCKHVPEIAETESSDSVTSANPVLKFSETFEESPAIDIL